MRQETKTYDVYKFEELTEEAQQKAIDKLYTLNIDYKWYDFTYEDAKRIGLEITGFDIGRGNYIEGDFPNDDAVTVAEKILVNHGENCDTFTLASDFLKEWENNDDCLDDDIRNEFLRAVKEEYLAILRREYEYLTSEEAIKESILANEYEFTKDGRLY